MTFINHHKKAITVVSIALLLMITILSAWRLRPLSEEELCASDAIVEREDCYLLLANGDTLLSFSEMVNDSLICGVTENSDSVGRVITRLQAQWLNRWPIIPSCRGRLAVLPHKETSICNASQEKILTIIASQRNHITQLISTLKEHREHTNYYLRTHNVTELGFDVVARKTKGIEVDIDSLLHVDSLLQEIDNKATLSIVRNTRYYAFVPQDSDTIRVECKLVDERNGIQIIRTIDGEKPIDLSTRLTVYDAATIIKHINSRPLPKRILPEGYRIDSLGLFHGEMDSKGTAHGYGRLSSQDGSYYEGEWNHGKRNGFGMSLPAGKRMCIGEWKDDSYLGERIIYTDERIYGIDISRYQHEKGRKRFKINWNNLAITSLGTKSKKDISGTVNYPISFIYIKSTEGKSVVNRYFFADYRAARQHGYKVGAYHFFSTKTSGASQAMHFLRKSRYQHGDLPPVLDVEPSPAQIRQMGGVNAMFAHIRKWLNMVETAWHVRPILYVSQTFVNKYLPSAPDLIKNYHVWIARYGEYKPDVNLVYWQLCPDGRVRGIQTEVDINVFNGFEAEWKEWIK